MDAENRIAFFQLKRGPVIIGGHIVDFEFQPSQCKNLHLEKARIPERDENSPDSVHFVTFFGFPFQVGNRIVPKLFRDSFLAVKFFEMFRAENKEQQMDGI